MANHASTTTMHGRIPPAAISSTRVYPIDLVTADALPGLAGRPRMLTSTFDRAEQAAAMNAVLVALNGLLGEGGAALPAS